MEEALVANKSPKERLLAAGLDLFAEKGYSSTSVRELVQDAGVTKPVLYYYFTSKEGLFRAVIDYLGEQQKRTLAAALKHKGSTLERLEGLIQRFGQLIKKRRKSFELVSSMIFNPPKGIPEYDFSQFPHRAKETIRQILLEGIQRGEVRDVDPDDASLLILGLIFISVRFAVIHKQTMDPKHTVRLLKLAFRGLEQREKEN